MSKNATATENSIDKRTLRAEWEGFEFSIPMPGTVAVRNTSKAEPSAYTVQIGEGGAPSSCECPDWTHREPNGGCKHMRAVAARSAVLDAASSSDGESIEEARPTDCACLPTFEQLPCWPCWQASFRTPNPNVRENQ